MVSNIGQNLYLPHSDLYQGQTRIQGQTTYHSLGQHPHCVTILAKLSLPAAHQVYLKTLPVLAALTPSQCWRRRRLERSTALLEALMTGGVEGR